jgi:phage shock protein C
MAQPLLTRDLEHAMLGGVCAGIARRWNYDATVVRVAAVVLTAFFGAGVIIYVALWIIMPADGAETATEGGRTERIEAFRNDLGTVSERASASAKVIARSTREAAEEIAGILRGRPAPGSATEDVVETVQERASDVADYVGERTHSEFDRTVDEAPTRAAEAERAAGSAAGAPGSAQGVTPEAAQPAQPAPPPQPSAPVEPEPRQPPR